MSTKKSLLETAMPEKPIIITVGEILVEFVSHKRNCCLEEVAEYSGPYPSGAPAIFLDQAARMGANTEMFGGVGSDGFGRSVLARLEDDRVGTKGICQSSNLSTGVAFVSYYDDGSRDFIFHLTNTAADNFDVNFDGLELDRVWLHVSAASLGNDRLRAEIMKSINLVSAAGGKITCDPNARPELMRDSEASKALAEVIARSTILLPSTSDLAFLYPNLSENQAIETMLKSEAEIVVLKRGSLGATVVHGEKRYDYPGHSVTEVDPTGAGDCFCGTFVALVAQGFDVSVAGRIANAAGAIAVTRRGPMEGNSSFEEIKNFLENEKVLSA